jgi:hypothetical protein
MKKYKLFPSQALNKVSEKISSTIGNLIPGEGITETSVELRDNNEGNGNYQFSILGVRDILSEENSNLFTQFSLHTQEINSDQRFIGNLGLGYRVLNDDQSMMYGGNIFWDQDISEGHQRIGFGLEGKASMLDFSFNQYAKATNQKVISGTKEQVLSGNEYNVSSQIPYMPWSTFNFQGYRWENEKAANDQKGNIYSLEMALTPSLEFNVEKDNSSVDGVDDQHNFKLVFVYPPKDNKPNLMNGAISELAFEKKDMKATLKDKIKRNNNLAVEIQGAVIITSK